MPDWVKVESDGQIESVTLELVTVVVTKVPIPKRWEQVVAGCGSGFAAPPPPHAAMKIAESIIAVRKTFALK